MCARQELSPRPSLSVAAAAQLTQPLLTQRGVIYSPCNTPTSALGTRAIVTSRTTSVAGGPPRPDSALHMPARVQFNRPHFAKMVSVGACHGAEATELSSQVERSRHIRSEVATRTRTVRVAREARAQIRL